MQSPVAQAALLRYADQQRLMREEGQDLLEYGLLVALIALVALAGVANVGLTIYTVFWKAIAAAF